MAIALVNSLGQGSTDKNGFTTSSASMTGANLLVVYVCDTNATSTLSDSQSNTYTVGPFDNTFGFNQIFYCLGATVSSSMTWTIGATNTSPALVVMGFSGVLASGAYDQHNASHALGASTIQPGSITPSGAGYLIVSGSQPGATFTPTIDSSFNTPVAVPGAANQTVGANMSYLVQATQAAINPTWAGTSANYFGATIVSFAPSASGGGSSPVPRTPRMWIPAYRASAR